LGRDYFGRVLLFCEFVCVLFCERKWVSLGYLGDPYDCPRHRERDIMTLEDTSTNGRLKTEGQDYQEKKYLLFGMLAIQPENITHF
jgi:hypothetical protein